jgi:hypothetical protein
MRQLSPYAAFARHRADMQSPLLAVHATAARDALMLIFALALAQSAPTPLTDVHQRDLACVAWLGLLARDQRAGAGARFTDVRNDGRVWAGIVGNRVMLETGQSRELIGYVIETAAEAQLMRTVPPAGSAEADAEDQLINKCIAQMQTELAALRPLPKPVKSQ